MELNTAAQATDTRGRSIRPVIEHALTTYFDGNADLANTLIERLIAEDRQATANDEEA